MILFYADKTVACTNDDEGSKRNEESCFYMESNQNAATAQSSTKWQLITDRNVKYL